MEGPGTGRGSQGNTQGAFEKARPGIDCNSSIVEVLRVHSHHLETLLLLCFCMRFLLQCLLKTACPYKNNKESCVTLCCVLGSITEFCSRSGSPGPVVNDGKEEVHDGKEEVHEGRAEVQRPAHLSVTAFFLT